MQSLESVRSQSWRVEDPLSGKLGWGVSTLSDRLYPNYEGDGQVFANVVQSCLQPGQVVLDAGCGDGKFFRYPWKDEVRYLVGCDRSEGIKENHRVHAPVPSDAGRLPFAPRTFDVIFSRYVWEHLEDPSAVFAEMARVLKPGGKLILLTPNRYHYVALVSRMTSHSCHEKVSVLRGNQPDDVFPTFYRSNTRRDMERLAPAGLRLDRFITREVRPNYLAWSLPAFLLGVLYERVVNRLGFLSPLRVTIVAVFSRMD